MVLRQQRWRVLLRLVACAAASQRHVETDVG
jgi:hypothetical protein